jgi:hypothetical protein
MKSETETGTAASDGNRPAFSIPDRATLSVVGLGRRVFRAVPGARVDHYLGTISLARGARLAPARLRCAQANDRAPPRAGSDGPLLPSDVLGRKR